jgi:hypothetical protein
MKFEEKLGVLQRGLQRRVVELPQYIAKLDAEAKKVTDIIEEYQNIVEQYKSDPDIRRDLRKDERLIALVGSKRKLKNLLYNEEEFIRVVESGMEEFKKNYGSEEFRFRMLAEEAQASLPDAEYLLQLIESGKLHKKTFKSFINLFLVPILTDWKQFEDDMAKKEEEKDE